MGNVYSSSHVKATRKPHVCEYCGRDIPVGSSALYEHGIYEGEAFARYCCQQCEPYIGDFWIYIEYESYDILGDFWEWVYVFHVPHPTLTVEIDCPSCGTVRVMESTWFNDCMVDCPKCGATLERQC